MIETSPSVISVAELQACFPAFMPKPLTSVCAAVAMRVLDLQRINELYARCGSCCGGAFAAAVLDVLRVRLKVRMSPGAAAAMGRFRADHVPFVVVANHPFGALDGIALLAWLTPLFPDFKLLANQLLQRVEPLRECLITVDPVHVDEASTHNRAALHQAFRHVSGGGCLGLFPTGRVATRAETRHPELGVWRPQVQKMLRLIDVPILPVHLMGRNTWLFYALGLLGWRVRSLRLPHEVFAKRGTVIELSVGDPLPRTDGAMVPLYRNW